MEFKKKRGVTSTLIQNGSTSLRNGIWNFTGSVGSNKNKDQVVIHMNSYSYASPNSPVIQNSYSGNNSDITYALKELRNKKLALSTPYSQLDNSGNGYIGSSELVFVQ